MNLQEKLLELKTAYYNVFKNRDAFGRMFKEHITERIVLLPRTYYLKKNQFIALMKTLEAMGEKSFYLSEIEFDDCFDLLHPKNGDTYVYKNDIFSTNISYEEYSNLLIVLENALYSSTGKWGVIISHEDYAVIGGTNEFMTLFKKFYPYWDFDLKYFIQMWQFHEEYYNSKVEWLPDFLSYVNTSINPLVKSTPEKWHQIEKTFVSVFKKINFYWRDIFQDSIQAKLLLFPTDDFYLSKKQFEMLLNVLKILDETSFYVFQLNEWSIEGDESDYFELGSNVSYEEYQKHPIVSENALYSTKGTWGIVISEDGRAIVGGSREFIELFKKFYPQWEQDTKAFVKMWQEKNKHDSTDISWIPSFLNYINTSSDKKE